MGKREELQSQLKDLRERLSNVKGDRDALAQSSGNSAAYNEQVSMGMFDESADLSKRATELKQQVAEVERQLAELPDAPAPVDTSRSLDYDAKAVPGASRGPDVGDVFGQKPTEGLDKAAEAAAAKAMVDGLWWQKPADDEPAAAEDQPSLEYTPAAIPGANPGVQVDPDEAFDGGASSGAPPRALIGVGIAVVLLVLGGVAMLRGGSTQSDAGAALPQTTSAAASAATGEPVAIGGGTYGPLKVTRGQGSSVSLYQLAATGPLPPNSVKWTLDAPCGTLAPLTASAQVSWSFDNNTKTCPPAGGPYPGTVKVTFIAPDGKTYTWTAGSDTGTYGETVTVR